MNICLISEEFPPETGWGGIGTYSYVLALGLTELGHRVHVISRSWGEDSCRDLGGVRLHRLSVPEPSWRRGTYTVNTYFYATREILYWNYRVSQLVRRIHADEKLDVVESPEFHAQGLWTTLGQRRVPVVVKLHTPAWLCRRLNGVSCGTSSRWDTLLSEHLEYRLARRARMVTSPSRRLADEVARKWRLDARAIRVVPNPVDVDLFCPGEAPPGDRTILYVGRIERRKGVETLIRAMPEVCRSFPGAELRLVGADDPSGPGGSSMVDYLRQRLRELGVAEYAVRFVGRVERAALPDVYRSAAVCVIPSHFENFPYTCLEAMASGCAVVASGVGGIPEIITHEVDGLLVPPGSPEILAAAVNRLLGNPSLTDRLRRQAPATVRSRFSRAVVAEQTAGVYRTVLG
jgi:glycosyltransferase involved in cell wall biosynthesis